jgi:hypothetical protein
VVGDGHGHVSCALGSEIAILNLKSGTYYGLDEIGAAIWSMIEKPTTIAAVRDALLERYEVEPARCESDLLNLLSELNSHGLIQIAAPD